jgi:hypothetical protein
MLRLKDFLKIEIVFDFASKNPSCTEPANRLTPTPKNPSGGGNLRANASIEIVYAIITLDTAVCQYFLPNNPNILWLNQ